MTLGMIHAARLPLHARVLLFSANVGSLGNALDRRRGRLRFGAAGLLGLKRLKARSFSVPAFIKIRADAGPWRGKNRHEANRPRPTGTIIVIGVGFISMLAADSADDC
jgi:hypothetical protein